MTVDNELAHATNRYGALREAADRRALAYRILAKRLAAAERRAANHADVVIKATKAHTELTREAAAQRAERRTQTTLDLVELFLPKRLRDEDISDAREVIHRLRNAGAPAWTLYLKTLTTGFWCTLNAIGYVLSALTGKAARKT